MVRAGEVAALDASAADGQASGNSAVAKLRRSRFLSDPAAAKAELRQAARDCGFSAFGVTRPDAMAHARPHLERFVAEGAHGDMAWMANGVERRGNPLLLWPQVRSVIMLGVNYADDGDPLAALRQPARGAISVYATRNDYHAVIKKRLKRFACWLVARGGGDVKVFVDTAAVMEKPLAVAAGLGWQGKHTNVVSRQFGSWLFLAAIFSTLDLPADDPEPDRCGSCRACLDICPTAAFPAPYRLDARKCISYLTIEHKGPIPMHLRGAIGNRVFGCDDCLAVCPWNKFAQAAHDTALATRAVLREARLAELVGLDDARFRALFAGTPVKRTGRERFVRNVLIAIGNSRDAGMAGDVEALLADASPLVRGAAIWALAMLDRARLRKAAAVRRDGEQDPSVQTEWRAALDEKLSGAML
ncbi:MAG: tRNA epoxyqueuosine(34) reductase QueG [Proteobacteria bacterium]|nr:tRNA epoxyqueuosine(34) reductase QueG [Pseudomonadota bacterium]